MYTRREFIVNGITTALALATGCAVTQRTPTNYNKNIGYVLLDLEHQAGFPTPAESYRKLEGLFEESRKRIKQNTGPVVMLQTIDTILNRSFTHSAMADTSLLGAALSKGRCDIDCDITSYLYLAIGEELNLPLRGVTAPEHFFVRWHYTDENYIDWETTSGMLTNDEHYARVFHVSPDSITRGIYLKSLSREELIGKHYGNIATEILLQGQYDKALLFLEKALENYPQEIGSIANTGVALEYLGHLPEALDNYLRALVLDPNNQKIHANLGKCLRRMGRKAEAEEHLRTAAELKKRSS